MKARIPNCIIKALVTIRPEIINMAPRGTVLHEGGIYPGFHIRGGITFGFCDNGVWLGVKPGEFEIISEMDTNPVLTGGDQP